MSVQTLKKANLADATGQDWHPADIIAALHKEGWTLVSLAEHYELKGIGVFSKALRFSSPKAEYRIADALGCHPKDIWPSRYYANGERKPQGFRAIQSNRKAVRVNGKDARENCHEAG